jgi:hypothetical protein
MFQPILSRLAQFSLLVLSLHNGIAQEADTVAVQFLTFPKTMEPVKVELLVGEGVTTELEVPSNELSPTIRVPRMSSWVFGKTETGEDQKPTFKIYGQAKALADGKQLILLIRKGKEISDGVDVRPIANDIATFGGGKFLFMNAAQVDVAGETGGVTFALKPGAMTIVKPKADANGRLFQAMFYFRRDNEPRPFFSSKWPISENTRGLIFFYHDPDTKQLRMHTIRHFLGE